MLTNSLSLKNRYCLKLIDSTTGKVKKNLEFHNVVLDYWFTCLNTTGSDWVAGLRVGTGTGTPAPTDTGLFRNLGSKAYASKRPVSVDDDYVIAYQWNFRFSENEVVGSLSEMGLYSWSGRLLTHALITDSEDSPIVVEKTDTDILLVSASVYATINHQGPFLPIIYGVTPPTNGWSDFKVKNPFSARQPAGSVYSTYSNKILLTDNFSSGSQCRVYYGVTSYPMLLTSRSSDATGTISTGGTAAVVNGWMRYTGDRILSDTGNGAATLLIKFLAVGGISGVYQPEMWIPLPNHEIYPPKSLNFKLVGDGETTDFNLGIAELLTEGVSVKIDGVVQPSSSYTFLGKDYNCSQAWPSQDNKFVDYEESEMSSGAYEYYNNVPWLVPFAQFTTSAMDNNTYTKFRFKKIVWDFQEPISVSRFTSRSLYGGAGFDPGLYHRTICLYSSDDKSSWSLVSSFYSPGSYDTWDLSFSPVLARYWKLECEDGDWVYGTGRNATVNRAPAGGSANFMYCAFGDPKPQLRFNTPPPADSVIEVQASCEYPIKNSNWLIDSMVVDCRWERDLT